MINWRRISDLEDCETLEQAKNTAKYILDMYNEPETTYYNDLHCDYISKSFTNTPEQIRANAKNHIKQLKAFLKSK